MIKKKIIAIISLLVILLLSLFIYNDYRKKKENYLKNFDDIQIIKSKYRLSDPFEEYFDLYGEFPESIEEVENLDSYYKENFIDRLSCDSSLIKYVPLINKLNERGAYLLISTGIDGKYNNQFKPVLESEVRLKFSFYNNDFKESKYVFIPDSSSYNILKALFGKKDYLISYVNGFEYYKSQVRRENILEFNGLLPWCLNKIVNNPRVVYKVSRRVVGYRFVFNESARLDSNSLMIQLKDYTINNNIPLKRVPTELMQNSEYILIGLFYDINTEKRTIDFKNCYILPISDIGIFENEPLTSARRKH